MGEGASGTDSRSSGNAGVGGRLSLMGLSLSIFTAFSLGFLLSSGLHRGLLFPHSAPLSTGGAQGYLGRGSAGRGGGKYTGVDEYDEGDVDMSGEGYGYGYGYGYVPSEYGSKLVRVRKNVSCDWPLVYNKPPKTASTFFQALIREWAQKQKRGLYVCSPLPLDNSVVVNECLPRAGDACGVVNCHIFLTPTLRAMLHERLPNHRLLTSTRYPAHRIVSYFLEAQDVRDVAIATSELMSGLRVFLKWYNPWRLYNYHTGEARVGSCPLRHEEMMKVWNMAARFDIVVDASLIEESNVILARHRLFQVSHKGERRNVRGATKLRFPPDIVEALRKVACVEIELHKALLMRMASLYEEATGKPCIRHAPRARLSSCLEDRERELLNDTWVF